MGNQNYFAKAAELAVKTGEMKSELAKKAFESAEAISDQTRSQGSSYLEKAVETAIQTGSAKADLAKQAFGDAGSLRRSVLNTLTPDGQVEDLEAIIGYWRFDSVELPGIGLRRNGTEMDKYYFKLLPDGKAIACVYGDTYETTWSVIDGCISFANMELASMKLTMHEDKLCLNGYLGVTISFVKCADEN